MKFFVDLFKLSLHANSSLITFIVLITSRALPGRKKSTRFHLYTVLISATNVKYTMESIVNLKFNYIFISNIKRISHFIVVRGVASILRFGVS